MKFLIHYLTDLERYLYGTVLSVREIITNTTPQSAIKPYLDYVPSLLQNNYFTAPKPDSERGCNFPQTRYRHADILTKDGSRIRFDIPIPSSHGDYPLILQALESDGDISNFIIYGEFIPYQLLRRNV